MSDGRKERAFRKILERVGVPRDGTLVVHSAIALLKRAAKSHERTLDARYYVAAGQPRSTENPPQRRRVAAGLDAWRRWPYLPVVR